MTDCVTDYTGRLVSVDRTCDAKGWVAGINELFMEWSNYRQSNWWAARKSILMSFKIISDFVIFL